MCSDYLCHLKEVRREQYSQGRITSDVPAPLEIQAVRDLVRARGKEMQAENLNAQVAAQVCMDLRGLPCFEVDLVDCGGLASAWINEAGVFAVTMASKLAKKSQRWVFSGLAEQMTDMLPSSALYIHFSPSDFLSVLKCSISSAGTSPAATCDFHASSCCLNVQVDAALSAGQLRQSLQKAFQQKQWQWACLLRMAMTFMPATLGRSDDLRKLPWSCLALRTQDGVGPTPSVAILCGSMQGKTVKPGQVDIPGVVRYVHLCCQTHLGSLLQCVLSFFASFAAGIETIASVLRQRLPTWLSLPSTGASNLRIWPTTLLQPLACRGISP